jgi:hypothetical protein
VFLEAELTEVTEAEPDCQDGVIIEGSAREFEASNENADLISNERSALGRIADKKAVK